MNNTRGAGRTDIRVVRNSESKTETISETPIEYFATCPKGFEQLLAEELKRLRAKRVRPLKSGVAFFGTQRDGYRVCLWSRIASRVLRVIGRVDAHDAETFYQGVKALPWEKFVGLHSTIAISARGGNEALRNTQFVGLKAKDALCDRLRELRGNRPDVAPHRPDVPVWISIHKKKATISIDYAGESLHRRGYRMEGETVEAPLKEALAAGMLVWGGWDCAAAPALRRAEAKRHQAKKGSINNEIRMGISESYTESHAESHIEFHTESHTKSKEPDSSSLANQGEEKTKEVPLDTITPAPIFVDPTCGSGTLVLEAAMMATDRAPGLSRDYWGFEGCADFDSKAFDDLLADADDRFEMGLEQAPKMVGVDIDPRAITIAQGNAQRLGLSKLVTFVCDDCANLGQVLEGLNISSQDRGFIALNPPYGVRLLNSGELVSFYDHLQRGLGFFSQSWQMVVITPDTSFDSSVGFDAERSLPAFNGALEVSLRAYQLGNSFKRTISVIGLDGNELFVEVASDHAEQFASRLRKMIKARRKWAHKHDIHAYRVYDADLPDYAVAVEVFEEAKQGLPYVLVSEYQAPREIDPQKAARRFKDTCAIAQALFDVPEGRLFTRVRKQEKGGSQYHREIHKRHPVLVEENTHLFEIDLSGYLDTGLFLDHRITRQLVGEMAKGKRFLNLFAYTGTASVYAAAGGALQTTTVDMSQTYLDWAQRNMKNSGFADATHRFVRADVLQWVEQQIKAAESFDELHKEFPQEEMPSQSDKALREKNSNKTKYPSHFMGLYDLVFLDPPTFSNSKTMGQRTWDIQRDHVELLAKVSCLVDTGGSIIFSGNLRSFKLDEEAVSALGLQVQNITAQTIPEDFSRNPRIHFCYLLTKK